MMPDTNQREIYFDTEDIFSKISEILEKNGLQETPLEAALKKEVSFTEIILQLTRDFIVSKISEKDFSTSIQKQLGTTAIATQNIIKDLKEKIIPLAKKATISENGKTVEGNSVINKISYSKESEQQKVPQKKSYPAKEKVLPKNKVVPASEKLDVTIKKNIETPNKKDSYREPIE